MLLFWSTNVCHNIQPDWSATDIIDIIINFTVAMFVVKMTNYLRITLLLNKFRNGPFKEEKSKFFFKI